MNFGNFDNSIRVIRNILILRNPESDHFLFLFLLFGGERVIFLYPGNSYLLHCKDNEKHGKGQVRPIWQRHVFHILLCLTGDEGG